MKERIFIIESNQVGGSKLYFAVFSFKMIQLTRKQDFLFNMNINQLRNAWETSQSRGHSVILRVLSAFILLLLMIKITCNVLQ